MAIQDTLKKLSELRAVLDRLARTDTTIYETISHDVEEAIRLTDESIAELTQESGVAEC